MNLAPLHDSFKAINITDFDLKEFPHPPNKTWGQEHDKSIETILAKGLFCILKKCFDQFGLFWTVYFTCIKTQKLTCP